MSGQAMQGHAPPAKQWLHWVGGLAVVLGLHGAVVILLQREEAVEDRTLPAAAVLLDLAPAPPAPPEPPQAPSAPPTLPPPAAPSPAPVPSEPPPPTPSPPEPAPAVDLPLPMPPSPITAAEPDAVLPPPPPPPRPVQRPRPRPLAVRPPIRSSPTQVPAMPEPSAPAAAPAASAPSTPAPGTPAPQAANWPSLLAAHLLRFRHYPPDAERRGFTGVALMRFSMDASGRIVSATLARSSGHDVLDQEAEAWLRRAQPLPPPPPDRVAPAQIVVPLSFTLR